MCSLVRPPQDNPSIPAPAAAEPIRPHLTGQPVQNNLAGQPKQAEPVTDSPSEEPPSGPVKPTVVTRRVFLKRPENFSGPKTDP